MIIYFIRHGQTKGNLEKRYIGTTDEALCEEGIKQIKALKAAGIYKEADRVYVSPMLRCLETAKIIYPHREYIPCPGLKECDFGEFENKNFIELSGNENYQKWIDSNGNAAFPSGESKDSFSRRCQREFQTIISGCEKEKKELTLAFVVHGGTIMSILSGLANPREDFYHWQVGNGEGFACEYDVTEKAVSVLYRL